MPKLNGVRPLYVSTLCYGLGLGLVILLPVTHTPMITTGDTHTGTCLTGEITTFALLFVGNQHNVAYQRTIDANQVQCLAIKRTLVFILTRVARLYLSSCTVVVLACFYEKTRACFFRNFGFPSRLRRLRPLDAVFSCGQDEGALRAGRGHSAGRTRAVQKPIVLLLYQDAATLHPGYIGLLTIQFILL